jgi:AcrR family transcriptional regulator
MTAPAKVRRTQEGRSATTRALLLEATIDALVEHGYAATTTTVIAERAGVSRGAQLHHYPTKAELVAAAVEHLAEKLLDQFGAALAERTDVDRIEFVIDAMWSSFSTPLLTAWVELSVAARSDDDLRARLEAVEDRLQAAIMARAEAADDSGQAAQVLLVLTMTLCLLEGITLESRASGGGRLSRLAPVMVDTWKSMVRTAFPNL